MRARTRRSSDCTAAHSKFLRDVGLTDAEIAEVVFAIAARSFFTRVLDGLGAHLDRPTADAFPADLRDAMIVGRPPA